MKNEVSIVKGIEGEVYYTFVYDYVYEIKIRKQKNEYTEVEILEAEEGNNAYKVGAIVNLTKDELIYETKEIAIKEMLHKAASQYEEVKKKFYDILNEYTYYNNLKHHYEEIFNIYKK